MKKDSPVQLTSSDPWDFDLLSPVPSTSAIPSPALTPTSQLSSRAKSPLSTTDDFELAFDQPAPAATLHLREEEETSLLSDADSARIKREAQDLLNNLSKPAPKPSSSRSISPPPHILGRLVELGFSIPQSKKALAQTYTTQWNVEVAADSLLSSTSSSSPEEVLPPRKPRQEERKPSPAASEADLLAQASVLGNTLFKQANAYWKSGKKVVAKAIEEQRVASTSGRSSPATTSNGEIRPKWMTDALPVAEDEPKPKAKADLFRDVSDEEEILPPRPTTRQAPVQPTRQPVQPKPAPQKVYQSSARRAVPQRSTPTAQPTAQPISQPERTPVPCSPSILAQANAYRQKGNEQFKLGAYGEAESSYSSALSLLPPKHLHRVMGLNNRANARLRNGNAVGCVADCCEVVTLVGEDLDEAEEVNLKEGLGKALLRRGMGYEALEKWVEAMKDYERLLGSGEGVLKAAGAAVVSAGLGRCRKALLPKEEKKVVPPKKRVVVVQSGEAVKELKEKARAAEKDEAAKDSLKDSVDDRVLAWKGGKESNIRALVASLETVLWPELGWKKVGMHELISESQLKVRYMRAIAKLHPDKVSLPMLLQLHLLNVG